MGEQNHPVPTLEASTSGGSYLQDQARATVIEFGAAVMRIDMR